MCVHMSRNVVISFAEGYSDVLDDKKIEVVVIVYGLEGEEAYIRGGYIRGAIHGTLQYIFSMYGITKDILMVPPAFVNDD